MGDRWMVLLLSVGVQAVLSDEMRSAHQTTPDLLNMRLNQNVVVPVKAEASDGYDGFAGCSSDMFRLTAKGIWMNLRVAQFLFH